MLSYQHAYHAGNFADVHKHLTVFAVIEHLLRKKSAITYIDTHAGRGLYQLAAKESTRLQEHLGGIEPLWQARKQFCDPLLTSWLSALEGLQASNAKAALSLYPGSPWWLGQRLREQDQLHLFELHPGEHEHLSAQPLPANTRRHYADGLAGLARLLPVVTPRLCVLLDPSYERKSEYQEVAQAVTQLMHKARHAVVLVWYPLLPAGHFQGLLEALRASQVRKIWRSELRLRDPSQETHGMYGSGMLVINPPWGMQERLEGAMAELAPLLGEQCRHAADWWVEE
ncbi:23S rRNA (adenine(2030)-N(6))-methyltransferase RlmJ [Vreelandella rituensis]|uniref:Ribosomal RNA large subunit methyltransferase J n=1 Tax=Vreelandella rituensis TaxID=2282306 RepID=A0A368U603_9GAMM|nr:23S rRNA (adenine(2030)-N(6))-methyltransferase RlmJ [Halomonas rituensis]RCV92435.1 23S rRNA (adenine(2030)-N(6))-methyltransferase RlmJ [Halomonas rituensis]